MRLMITKLKRKAWSIREIILALIDSVKMGHKASVIWGIHFDHSIKDRIERRIDWFKKIADSPLSMESRNIQIRIARAMIPWVNSSIDIAVMRAEQIAKGTPGWPMFKKLEEETCKVVWGEFV